MGVAEDLPGYGVQMEKYPFKDDNDWLLGLQDPRSLFLAQPSYVIAEFVFYAIGFLTFVHSFIVGGRWKYLWLGAFLHGLATEMMALRIPDMDETYWHSQSSVMLFGRRLPLHVTFLYPTFMYISAYIVAHMKLPKWAQPMAAGLLQILLHLPYALVSLKFLHLTWHDTHPHISERHYSVPWTAYFLHLTFGTSFHFFINFWRKKITGSDDEGASSTFFKEIICTVLSAVCGVPGGLLQMTLLYQPLKGILELPSENCFLLVAVFYLMVVWEADRSPRTEARRNKGDKSHWSVFIPVLCLLAHYGLYMGLALFGAPEKEVSIGLHQPIGACNHYSEVRSLFGPPLKKQTYLCPKTYDEKYFDFHCLKAAPKNGVSWYTACGTAFENRTEFSSMVGALCLVALFVYYNLLFRSAATVVHKRKTPPPSDKKKAKKH